MRTLPVGQLQLTILDDGTWPFPAREFFANVPETTWRPHLDTDAKGKIPVGHNYALLKAGQELVVIDTGYGDDTHGGCTGHLLEEFDRTGYRREQVTKVIITHAHGDHIKRNTLVRDGRRTPTFPNASYHLARADWEWFNGPRGKVHGFDEQIGAVAALGMLVLGEGELQLLPEVRLLPTPGHTPGHTSVLMESQGQAAMFVGDLCHHPLHFSHPGWVSSFDTDPQLTPQTRARVFPMAADCNALLVCPHAPSPGLGRLARTGTGFAWAPEPSP